MTRILLDTHALLWWWTDHPRLPEPWRESIAKPDTSVHVSAASAWEISIKALLGRLDFPAEQWEPMVERDDFQVLPMSDGHALAAGSLDWEHTDPFDRMLVAQAQLERLQLLTADTAILQYLR